MPHMVAEQGFGVSRTETIDFWYVSTVSSASLPMGMVIAINY